MMYPNVIERRRAATLLGGRRLRVYRTEQLPPLGAGGWSTWESVVADAALMRLDPDGVSSHLVVVAARDLAMTRLLEVRAWDGAGSHHVTVLPLGGSFTLVFAVVTPPGPVFTVSPVAIASLRRHAVRADGSPARSSAAPLPRST
jgi:hypothetical protein